MLVAQISWPILAVVFLAGLVIGAVLVKMLSPKAIQNNKIKHQLTEKELELSQVKDDVNNHFLRTAEGLAALSKQLTNLQNQLTEDAQGLASQEEITEKLRVLPNFVNQGEAKTSNSSFVNKLTAEEFAPPKDYAASSKGGTLNENFFHPNFEQPKDYAPNSSGGTLAEDFGFRSEEALKATSAEIGKTKKKKKKKKKLNQEAEAKN